MIGKVRQSGGLVGLNTGSVVDCYSQIQLRPASNGSAGGFCGENRGNILRSFAQGTVSGRRKKSGFCALQKGSCANSAWLRRGQHTEAEWTDWAQSLSIQTLNADETFLLQLSDIWFFDQDRDGDGNLRLYDRSTELENYDRVVEIDSRKALEDFARQVNSGSADRSTLFRLTADIDLGGRAWVPAGMDPNTPFQSGFDGEGHRITNFMLRAGKQPFAGFFGYVGKYGKVSNLNLDCQVLQGGSTAAPLCAVNEGTISNCTATSRCGFSRCTGGLVGQNSGTITRCAALGRMGKESPVPWWATALLLLLLCFPLPIYFSLTAQAAAQEIFAPVILDPNAQPIEPDQEITPTPEEITDTSASFIMNTEMYIATDNYTGTIGLRCPSWSTRGFVATLRLTAEDQEKIGYAGGGEMIALYQSGLIAPGYGVNVITLGALPDGSHLPAGTYELSVLLEFYDIKTNEKSSVNTVVPLEVTVG